MTDLNKARVLIIATDGFEQFGAVRAAQGIAGCGRDRHAGLEQERADPGHEAS